MSLPLRVDVDYLVVGAGATGMAFTDALIDHDPRARVALVDRRSGVGGHWLAAYPFVRLHQDSSFYGVASTRLGGGAVQRTGPEAGLGERADQPTICGYYADLLADRFAGSVEFFGGCDHLGGRLFASLLTGQQFVVPERCRIVDARYLAPDIPAELPPRFEVLGSARVIPVNDLVRLEDAPSDYVVVGSGKTATDAIVWLLGRGVDPDAICWVRPREPWMLNRELIVPDPVVYLGMVATMLEAAAGARSLDALFLDLEAAGVMLRIDPTLTPTMAKAPTLGRWELALLQTVDNVVRRGHLVSVSPGRLSFASGHVTVARDAVVVNCAADGLKDMPLVPVWRPAAITLQPVRAGFPCFGAALTGYVEATRATDDEKNALVQPSSYGNSLTDWARMQVLGLSNTARFNAEPDVREWADRVALNASRVPPEHAAGDELSGVQARLSAHLGPATERLAELMV